MMLEILQILYFLVPAYFANMTPVFARHLQWFNTPLDFGHTFRKKPLFGKNKTWRGLILGVLVAMIVFWGQQLLYVGGFTRFSLIVYPNFHVLLGGAIGFGALMGDAFESFFKRQRGKKSGESWFPWDQIDFVFGAMFVTIPYWISYWLETLIALVVIIVITVFIQRLGYWLRLKSDPL